MLTIYDDYSEAVETASDYAAKTGISHTVYQLTLDADDTPSLLEALGWSPTSRDIYNVLAEAEAEDLHPQWVAVYAAHPDTAKYRHKFGTGRA